MKYELYLGNSRGMVVGPFEDNEGDRIRDLKKRLSPKKGEHAVIQFRAHGYVEAHERLARYIRDGAVGDSR